MPGSRVKPGRDGPSHLRAGLREVALDQSLNTEGEALGISLRVEEAARPWVRVWRAGRGEERREEEGEAGRAERGKERK